VPTGSCHCGKIKIAYSGAPPLTVSTLFIFICPKLYNYITLTLEKQYATATLILAFLILLLMLFIRSHNYTPTAIRFQKCNKTHFREYL
jgi:hypothetical protein